MPCVPATAVQVGGSGSGKSTVVGLLLRFYDPTAGRVLLDSRPLPTLSLRSLRSHVGLVSKRMGRPGAT